MKTFKRCILGAVSVAMVAAGVSLFSKDAEAFQCRPTAVPFGFKPTTATCSQTCDSRLYQNNSGDTMCVILGPKAPISLR